MAYNPPSIDVFSTDDMRQFTDYIRDAGMGVSDFLANQAVAMHPRIAETLRDEGVDEATGLFGRGSLANQNASRITGLLKRSADHFEAGAKLAGPAAWRAWQQYLVTPVEVARRARERGTGRQRIKV